MLHRLVSLFEPAPRSAEGWLVRLGRPAVSPRLLARFEIWLAADPRNLDDYEALKATLRRSQALRSRFVGELNLIARPRGARARRAWTGPAVVTAGGLVAAALVVAVWPGAAALWAPDPLAGAQTFQTATGEIRDIVLADGSRLTLDTATTIRARVDGPVRRVAVDRGAVYFAVAHDRARPFVVGLADRAVVVTGTHFTTTLQAGQARVALLEGRVAVTEGRPAERDLLRGAVRLKPGDQVSYRPGTAVRAEARIDPATAAAWRQHRLIFQDAPLSQVVAELARYTDTRMRIADPALGRQRVTAIFPLDGAGSVIARADRLLPVRMVRSGPGEVTVRAR